MAFNPLNDLLIQVGKPLIKSIFDNIRSNEIDLNDRLLSVEASGQKIEVFNGTILTATAFSQLTGFVFYRFSSNVTLTDAKVGIFDKGAVTSGTLSVDIQKANSLDFSSSVSVFTTEPSLNLATDPNYSESSNAVFNGASFSEGDYLRLDISSLPVGLNKFQIYLIGEPS
jgi:hypothetical protein